MGSKEKSPVGMSPRYLWCDKCGMGVGIIIRNDRKDPPCPLCQGPAESFFNPADLSARLIAFAVVDGQSKL